MITEACFATFGSMFACVGQEAFGSILLASIVFLIIMAYVMHKGGMSFTASIPLAFVVLYGLLWTTMEDIFGRIILIILTFVIAIMALVLIRHFYGR